MKAFLASPLILLFFIASIATFYSYTSKIDSSQSELILNEIKLMNSIFENKIFEKNVISYAKILALSNSSKENISDALKKGFGSDFNLTLLNKNGYLVLKFNFSELNTNYPYFLLLDEAKKLNFNELNCLNFHQKINSLDGKFNWEYNFWNYSSKQIFLKIYIIDNSSYFNSKYPFYLNNNEYFLVNCS